MKEEGGRMEDEGCPPGPFDGAEVAAHALQEPPALPLSRALGTLLEGGQHPVCPDTFPVLFPRRCGDAQLSPARVRPLCDGAGLSACVCVHSGLQAHSG